MAITYKINQIATLVDSVYNQSIGKTAMTAQDASGLVSMGDTVLSSSTNKDAFFRALMDRIGKVVVAVEEYIPKKRAIYKNTIEFGNALQMMIFEAGTSSVDRGWAGVNSWNGNTRQAQASPFDNAPNTTAKQYIFSQRAGWEYDDVIPDFQLKTAFTSSDSMAAFISGLYMAKANKLALDVENTGNLAIGYAATKATEQTGKQFYNALYEYNTNVLGLTATVEDSAITYPTGWVRASVALKSKEFLRYLSERITILEGRLHTFTEIFNKEAHPYACNDVAVEVLTEVASACKYNLESDTYHNDLVKLPDGNYSEREFWNGSGTTFAYDDCSKVIGVANKIIPNVACLIYDKMAVMTTVEDYRANTLYNPKDEVMNTYDKCNLAYAVCPFRDFVVVQIADPVIVDSAVSGYNVTTTE